MPTKISRSLTPLATGFAAHGRWPRMIDCRPLPLGHVLVSNGFTVRRNLVRHDRRTAGDRDHRTAGKAHGPGRTGPAPESPNSRKGEGRKDHPLKLKASAPTDRCLVWPAAAPL
jgi:hypothetical protein